MRGLCIFSFAIGVICPQIYNYRLRFQTFE